MDSFLSHRLTDWLFLVAAIVASMVIFSSLEKVSRSLFVPFVVIAIGLIAAKVAFGLTPQHLWHESVHLIRRLGAGFY
ncbi:hypothetical protein VB774_01765 [Pseudanabaena galeata UHCC 0370]|jgi:multidrug transporter EmrE-like cation transporter|uniref:Uncharacterized protein n=1 Tax=Pseudanabaena galeata UHCC 0370 TaxID=3110310 RepID=A0ABU5TDI9_9CYAN|nr:MULTISPECIES: hypothetical protein [Pseudanabaena]MEA5476335.1 hypothetical protein [Pseudanabaena galeata UHCC 0370]MEA5485481.1 hypothetical protein [Pseudanabaena sp. CCNP1317]WGS73698.1 hypothetical protein OA858_06605 [Pseudanabaena galeata CCNP1313]